MGTNLLTIVDESDHDTITIFGVEYDVLSIDDFGIIEQRQLSTYSRKYFKFIDSDTLHPDMSKQVLKEINTFIKLIIPELPDDVLNNIKERKRFQIAEVFSARLNKDLSGWDTPEAEAEPGTFEKAITEAVRATRKPQK